MEKIKLEAHLREKVGKEKAKKVRKEGSVPAIIYGKGTNLAVQISSVGLKTLRSTHFSQSTIIDMDIANAKKKETFAVLIKDVQYHPLSEAVMHMDFIRVSLEEKIKVNIPVVLKGEAKGIKDGGILEQILWHLTIEGLPLDVPQKIEVDVSDLAIGNSVHVQDIKVADNVRLVNAPGETIATVVEKKEEEIVAPTPEEAAPTGPEVIKEKKETEEGEEGATEKEEPKAKEEPKGKPEPKAKEEKAEKGKK
ncbi:MAG: 50S ribosomal protein L25 [Candidatus Omnitrophota bacterium]|nr:50S ribosomal protein L25 [Candidatus Omnitrophota bacterium]